MSDASRKWADYDSAPAHKLLSDNRERYIAQSAATRGGLVAPLPPHPQGDQGECYARKQMADGGPDPIPDYASRRGS